MNTFGSRVLLLALSLIVCITTIAGAASISATVNPDPMLEQDSLTWSDPSFSVSAFDTNLGVLTSVDLLLNGSATANVSWETTGDLTSGTYFVNSALSLVPTGVPANVLVLNTPQISGTKTNLIGAQSGTDIGAVDVTGASANSLTAAGDLALFTTGANVILDLLLSTSSGALSNPAGVFSVTGFLMDVGADLTVTYNYNEAAVPEPATILLLGSGLAGLAGYRRKQKMSNNV